MCSQSVGASMRFLRRKRLFILVVAVVGCIVLAVVGSGNDDGERYTRQTSGVKTRKGEKQLRGLSWAKTQRSVSQVFRKLTNAAEARDLADGPYFSDDEPSDFAFVRPDELEHSAGWHKPLHPMDSWDFIGFGLASIGLMIAAAGGIGGGGILVPLYILVLGFHAKHAIPLSNITIFGGAITNTVLNLSKRHPDADRPLVDWDLILVMEPLTIGGALVGSFINKVTLAERTTEPRQRVVLR